VFRADPYASHQFEVVIDGISDDGTAVKGSFAECTGLDVSMDPIEYRNGSEDFTVRKIPGLKKFTNITLKRGRASKSPIRVLNKRPSAHERSSHMVTIQNMQVRFDVEGESDEHVFARLFHHHIRHWATNDRAQKCRERQDREERSLGDRESGGDG
jgi:phage tail-like protein